MRWCLGVIFSTHTMRHYVRLFCASWPASGSFSAELKVREIEIATHVPKKFRFPLFSRLVLFYRMTVELGCNDDYRLCWYVGEKFLRDLRAKEVFTPRVLDSIEALSDFLVSEVRVMERGPESIRRDLRDQVPADKVKDAPALARELRWRVRLAEGYTSDGDRSDGEEPAAKYVGRKRRREGGLPPTSPETRGDARFRNFQPKVWEALEEENEEGVRHLTVQPIQDISSFAGSWNDWNDEPTGSQLVKGDRVEVGRRRHVIVKMRRTDNGFERQRIERVVETWSWENTEAVC